MTFCPGCGCEFREGLRRCPDCDLALVADLEQADGRRAGLRRGGRMVSVLRAERPRVEMLADLLDQEGVESIVHIAANAADPAGEPLAELHVLERDARDRADLIQELIAELPEMA